MKKVEISLKEIIVSIINNWVMIVLIASLFALLFSAVSFFQRPQGEDMSKKIADYEANLSAVENRSQMIIDEQTKKIIDLKKLLSDLQNAATYDNKMVVEATVEIQYNASVVDIYRTSKAYLDFYSKVPLNIAFEGMFQENYSDEFLRKIISIIPESIQGLPKIIKIRAIGVGTIRPNDVISVLLKLFEDNNRFIAEGGGENTLLVMDSQTYDQVKTEIMYEETISLINSEIEAATSSIEDANVDVVNAKDKYAMTVSYEPIVNQVFLGSLVGLVIGVFFAAIKYLYRLPVVLPEQISNQLGLRYIGGYRHEKQKLFSGLANYLAGSFLVFKQREKALEYVSTNLKQAIIPEDTLLVTGSISISVIDEFAKELMGDDKWQGTKIITAPDINTSVEGLAALEQCNKVVLVERLKKSTLKNIAREIDRIDVSGKEIVGYVLY